ncbi:integration host factor, actinobacterial type [Streptomyces sp. NPDC093982]|uniref:integration host factor, actinobacterial type n=1 Tax=Streptomyces sp. NPDC093982 TaxID=3155077 RepID=UPI003424301E
MPVPVLTAQQRQAASKKSAAVRRERLEVRTALKDARMSLAEALASDSEVIRSMPVRTLLASLPGIGQVRAQKILNELEISDTRRIRGLGARQRERLLARFASTR